MSTKSSLPAHAPKHMVGMFFIFGAAIVLAVLIVGCWMWGKKPEKRLVPVTPVVTSTVEEPSPSPSPSPTTSTLESKDKDPYYTEINAYGYTEYEFDRLDYETRQKLVMTEFLKRPVVDVDWQEPVKVPTSTIPALIALPEEGVYQPPLHAGPYLRGIVTTGDHTGWKVYSYTTADEGLGGIYYMASLVLISPDGKAVDIGTGSNSYGEAGGIADSNERLRLETPPSKLTLANGKMLTSANSYFVWNSDCWITGCKGYKKIAETREGLTLFKLDPSYSSNYYVFMKDGRSFSYRLALPGSASIAPPEAVQDDPVYLPKIFQWGVGYKNQDSFVEFYRGGCGDTGTSSIMNENQVKTQDLIVIGKTVTGETLYGVKDYKTHPLTAEAYDYWFQYDAYGEKPDIENFLKDHPVPYFFYRNPLGELVRYVLGDGVRTGECGKPVIYLYPSKTTNVSVKLGSNINVTVSEPTYPAQGWNVVAQPNGNLLYQGKMYGSLFWEGTGVGYDVPTTGFLIKDGEVDQQLAKILAKYGLNQKESAEFREFWVPKMTGAKYYRVSFVETAAWNKAAPLMVSPRPTSVLRIFMDWQKLSKPVKIEEPKIQPFVRDGFTLVEWGGLLRK